MIVFKNVFIEILKTQRWNLILKIFQNWWTKKTINWFNSEKSDKFQNILKLFFEKIFYWINKVKIEIALKKQFFEIELINKKQNKIQKIEEQ